jgi:pyruvate, water dikinase
VGGRHPRGCSSSPSSPRGAQAISTPTTSCCERLDRDDPERRRPQQRHGRGPARGELRRPAGDLLNITGADALLDACKRCYASLFTDRAINYREDQGFDHRDVALSVGVQQMVRSDLAGPG